MGGYRSISYSTKQENVEIEGNLEKDGMNISVATGMT
jgi:hypothetical protein